VVGQWLSADIELSLDLGPAASTDDLGATSSVSVLRRRCERDVRGRDTMSPRDMMTTPCQARPERSRCWHGARDGDNHEGGRS
jgi:hypothetical protein